ncbi:hypothetical protein [Winogradskyella sp. J14-2]|uniref:hypothetical protein n=1 Tax=Winogradskyella sp. J14-2 TaxID=1936080 RepID=UPI0018DBBCE7|nr:hypothetical protein [Winogradskyella sp. J14-2]
MKRLIGIILLLTLTSCSYMTDFYIFNKSGNSIFVEYKVKERLNEEPFAFNARIVEFDSDMEIIEIKKAFEIEFNNEINTLTCELKNGQALWIGDDINFSLNDANDIKKLKRNLIYLKIKTENTEINADEKNIIGFFKTFDRHTVGIEIK